MDVIKNVDHIIDLGPQGGARGGKLVAEGTPEQVAQIGREPDRPVPAAAARQQERPPGRSPTEEWLAGEDGRCESRTVAARSKAKGPR